MTLLPPQLGLKFKNLIKLQASNFIFYLSFISALLLASYNVYQLATSNPQVLSAKLMTLSFSKGDRYFGYLQLWLMYVQRQDWDTANYLETKLDTRHLEYHKNQYSTAYLQKQLNQLVSKNQKTVEEWIRLAQLQYMLNYQEEARLSLDQARAIDPLRDDIPQL